MVSSRSLEVSTGTNTTRSVLHSIICYASADRYYSRLLGNRIGQVTRSYNKTVRISSCNEDRGKGCDEYGPDVRRAEAGGTPLSIPARRWEGDKSNRMNAVGVHIEGATEISIRNFDDAEEQRRKFRCRRFRFNSTERMRTGGFRHRLSYVATLGALGRRGWKFCGRHECKPSIGRALA